ATLLVFRVLYFVIPFATAISIMSVRDRWLNVVKPWQQRRRLQSACDDEVAAKRAAATAAAAVPHRIKRRHSQG
ncbi:MAG: UPF0104 family protein, partial [Bradyrhizobium sp.]|nr:UPF0104 family protein [Bradyrhizobium sp.]